ncbi:hypothetical protein M422DRAFT_48162 [Sphaerobolus stellatus SS14]|uniref:Unplaced genomic scaffold SPHSTscaffold_54, whole genome shotgun sequence n=1 Tax=Sphaerobolus stellatus (strain SS14) TaxID=990650 RepID=A0A0C9V6D0_SPHS4|nr:hypothetical protein M422DRAFT_48162 [Sphaerobolus stellatus SS14]
MATESPFRIKFSKFIFWKKRTLVQPNETSLDAVPLSLTASQAQDNGYMHQSNSKENYVIIIRGLAAKDIIFDQPPSEGSAIRDTSTSSVNRLLPNPNIWAPGVGSSEGKWVCRVCNDRTARERKFLNLHESGATHKRKLEQRTLSTHQTTVREPRGGLEAATRSESGNPSPTARQEVRGMLDQILDNIQQGRSVPSNIPDFEMGYDDYSLGFEATEAQMQNLMAGEADGQMHASQRQIASQQFAEDLEELVRQGGEWELSSDDDSVERSDASQIHPSDEEGDYKETCILDILQHIPWSALSDKQLSTVEWRLHALGVENVPSPHVVDEVAKVLQASFGIKTIRYDGKLGHIYYLNELAGIITQEIANPLVRPHLAFLPEDSSTCIAATRNAHHWLYGVDESLLIPMVRVGHQDFYIFKPAITRHGNAVIPFRFFTQGDKTLAKVWFLENHSNGWIVAEDRLAEYNVDKLTVSFPDFVTDHPDPCIILGSRTADNPANLKQWTRTMPKDGNEWRHKANGKRVVVFPIWLYCDDTLGNVSKKWNKHNSFLFTPAGLPHEQSQLEYNVHFLCTSNLAPPLEMLEGIADDLEKIQEEGILAYDCVLKELVLVTVFVLALLGDNPMQKDEAQEEQEEGDGYIEGDGSESEAGSETSIGSQAADQTQKKSKMKTMKPKKKKIPETLGQMIDRITRFMKVNTLRTPNETKVKLQVVYSHACQVGGKSNASEVMTSNGIKDTYQLHFIEQLYQSYKGISDKEAKQAALDTERDKLPFEGYEVGGVFLCYDFLFILLSTSGLNPHQDTPVEILHVIPLGFIKYFWHDSVAKTPKAKWPLLMTRLESLSVGSLNASPLSGKTFVTHARSLTGGDFRLITQLAPFCLYDLVSADCYQTWVALGALVPVVWQPVIEDMNRYLERLEATIERFLVYTTNWTPQWFNKPKLHILVYLPDHIRCFGPAMLFATEAFESFNAVIRERSMHSNHQAPSRDIARSLAHANQVHHLLSQAAFLHCKATLRYKSGNPILTVQESHNPQVSDWVNVGEGPLSLLSIKTFGEKIMKIPSPDKSILPGITCKNMGKKCFWWDLKASSVVRLAIDHPWLKYEWRAPEQAFLQSSDWVKTGDWIIWKDTETEGSLWYGCIGEMLQSVGTVEERNNQVNMYCVQEAYLCEQEPLSKMPQIWHCAWYEFIDAKVFHLACHLSDMPH